MTGRGSEPSARLLLPLGARRLLAPAALILVLGGAYGLTLVPGLGRTPDSAEFQFSARLLCVTHPTGNPLYLLLGHVFSRVVPIGSPAYRANLLSASFAVLACLVFMRLLRRLGTRTLVAWTIAVAFGLTHTFWQTSVVAEVYSLNLLLLALVSDALLRWRQTLQNRHLLVACAWYVASFGNHLTMVTLLPAFACFVLATRWRVVTEWRLVAAVLGLILLGLTPYAYPVLRSLDPSTPYLAYSVTNLEELVRYATGGVFRADMFAFTASDLLRERVPMFLRLLWDNCTLLLPLAAVGLVTLADRVTRVYLALAFLGHAVFALGYAIGEIDVFFIPAFFVTAALAGAGLEWILASRAGRHVPATLCLLLPLGLAASNAATVQRSEVNEDEQRMRQLVEASRDGALIVARYNDYMQMLYLSLAEGIGGPALFLGCEVDVADIVAYLRDDRPLYLKPLRKWAPPGLAVFDTRLDQRAELRAAGFGVKMVRPGVFRVSLGARTGAAVVQSPSSSRRP